MTQSLHPSYHENSLQGVGNKNSFSWFKANSQKAACHFYSQPVLPCSNMTNWHPQCGSKVIRLWQMVYLEQFVFILLEISAVLTKGFSFPFFKWCLNTAKNIKENEYLGLGVILFLVALQINCYLWRNVYSQKGKGLSHILTICKYCTYKYLRLSLLWGMLINIW